MEKLEKPEDIEPKVEKQEKVLRELFRILTPDEIDFLCQMTDGMPKVPLTTLIEKELKNKTLLEKRPSLTSKEDRRAKILPFKKLPAITDTQNLNIAVAKELSPAVSDTALIQTIESLPEKKLEGSELVFQKEQVIIEKKIDRIKFLLEQREKFRKHYVNLKKAEVYELYVKEADVSIGTHELNEDGSQVNFSTENKGILINKKCS